MRQLRTGVYTVTERLDMAMVKRHDNFGYTDAEIQKYFDYPQVFEYDATGLAPGAIKAPPPPGVHPRVLFHPDDLPALRRRLVETKPGKMQMDGIRAMLARDLTGPNARFGALYEGAARGDENPALLDVGVFRRHQLRVLPLPDRQRCRRRKKGRRRPHHPRQAGQRGVGQAFAEVRQKAGRTPRRTSGRRCATSRRSRG